MNLSPCYCQRPECQKAWQLLIDHAPEGVIEQGPGCFYEHCSLCASVPVLHFDVASEYGHIYVISAYCNYASVTRQHGSRYCISINHDDLYPGPDSALAILLTLRTNEAHFLKIAVGMDEPGSGDNG